MFDKLPVTKQADIKLKLDNLTTSRRQIVVRQELSKSLKYKRELLKHHKELRVKGLAELKEIRKKEGNEVAVNIITKIEKKEMTKNDWTKTKQLFNPTFQSGICTIEVPSKDANGNDTTDPDKATTWKTITNPKEVESFILKRNVKHFGQANDTIFVNTCLQNDFHYEGVSDAVDMLLEGNYDYNKIPNLTNGAKSLLNRLGDQNRLSEIPNDITFEEFTSALKKWSEGTSTSPSGRHLGHYKCTFVDDNCSKKYETEKEYTDPKHNIMKVYYHITHAAVNIGVSLKRWQTSITSMIEKIPGCPKINKLRVIHLYEADYNLVLKILWARRLVWHVHNNKRLNEGQAGSRPGRNSIDVVIQKEMKYLYSLLTKTGLATMDNDAKSCYDRIICDIAMIISQYFGISSQTVSVQSRTLRKMRYRLRTALGDSKGYYEHTQETPIHGTGQGSCASPALWLIISSILMDCLSELSGGMTMKDVTNVHQIKQWIDGFVDDTSLFSNLINTGFNPNDVHTLHQNLARDMTAWQELLEASGGKLELSKCFYYILSWKFDHEGKAIPTTIIEQRTTSQQILINETSTGNKVKIQQKEAQESHKTLGCFKSITGNSDQQLQYLKARSDKYANAIKNGKLTRKQARMAYKTIYIPSLQYGLPACSLSENNIDYIQRYSVDKFLSAMGIDHSTPREIVFGPQEFGGLGLPHLFTQMMGMKLESLIAHIRSQTELGKSMMVNINYIQLISGRSEHFMESNDNIDYVDSNWILHLRKFMLEINAKIEIRNLWTINKLRENDVILMNAFGKLNVNTNELRLINRWRLFFNVNTLCEICTPDGSKIHEKYLNIKQVLSNNTENVSKWAWPEQGQPGKRGFSLWKKCLQQSFQIQNNGRICHSFGNWLFPECHEANTWKTYYHPVTNRVYVRLSEGYEYMIPIKIKSSHVQFPSNTIRFIIDNIPHGCIPAQMTNARNMTTVYFSKSHIVKTTRHSIIRNEQIAEEWYDSMIENYDTIDEEHLTNALQGDQIVIVSDGGVHEYQGTFGVVISNGTEQLATNHGKIYSVDFMASPYRSELYSMLAGIMTLHTIMQGDISNKEIILYSDCKELVKKIQFRSKWNMTVNQHRGPDADLELQLLYEIQQLLDKHNTVSCRYVRGHQELKKLKSDLKHEEQLNIIADQFTKQARRLSNIKTYQSLPANNVNIIINNDVINSKYREIATRSYFSIFPIDDIIV